MGGSSSLGGSAQGLTFYYVVFPGVENKGLGVPAFLCVRV